MIIEINFNKDSVTVTEAVGKPIEFAVKDPHGLQAFLEEVFNRLGYDHVINVELHAVDEDRRSVVGEW